MKINYFRAVLLLGGLAGLMASAHGAELALQAGRGDPDDLALSGNFAGIPAGETRYVSRAALLKLPGVERFREKPAPPIAVANLEVLPLDRLLAQLPLAAGADGLVLVCADRWETLLTADFVAQQRPYLLLTYDGRTPAQGWPTFGSIEALAPYFSNVSPSLGSTFKGPTDLGFHDATQIVEIRAVNTRDRYSPFYAGPLAALEPKAAAGRKLFLQQCNNCHQGPAGVGGNVSLRPFIVLQVHATLNADYFKKFVRNPKQFIPATIMPKHEEFTDDMLAELMAFLAAAKAGEVNEEE